MWSGCGGSDRIGVLGASDHTNDQRGRRMRASSRTPDGLPIRCSICGAKSTVLVSAPPGDTVCPVCGSHLWVPRRAFLRQRHGRGIERIERRWRRFHRRTLVCDHTAAREATFPVRVLRVFLQHRRDPSLWDRLMLWWTNQSDRKDDPWATRACGIIDSMTEHERSCPYAIGGSRIRRIAAGSGTSRRCVDEFLQMLVDLERDL